MTSTTLPNAFSTPNFFVDKLMHLLTSDEFKVLIHATRHILGWKDSFDSRENCISLSRFENGFTDSKGNHYEGCGLSRPAINNALKILVETGIMIPVGDPTSKGQAWKLPINDSDIDYEALQERKESKKKRSRKKIAKAAIASAEARKDTSGTTDVPADQYVGRTSSGTTDVPEGGTTDVHMQIQEQIQEQIQDIADTPLAVNETPEPDESISDTETQQSDKPLTEHQVMFGELCDAFGYDADSLDEEDSKDIGKVVSKLRGKGAQPGDIRRQFLFLQNVHGPSLGFENFTIHALPKYWKDYAAVEAKKSSPPAKRIMRAGSAATTMHEQTQRVMAKYNTPEMQAKVKEILDAEGVS